MTDMTTTRRTPTVAFAIAGAAMLAGSALAGGGTGWMRQSPYPADVDLDGVYFITPQRGFITGHDDLFMVTDDGGETWEQVSGVVRDPLFSESPTWDIQFVDEMHGFAAGNLIYRTVDGGATWQTLGSQGTIYDIDFITPQVGYLASNLSIEKTTNGGQSYTMIWHWQNQNYVTDIDFIDENTGYVAGEINNQYGIYRTTDGGQSFQQISSQVLHEILWLGNDVLVGSRDGNFYRSTDGGENWTLVFSDPADFALMEEMCVIDEDSVAAIDINTRIWISNDAGQTWERTLGPVGNWGFEWDIHFADSSTGYAVGRLGMIFKTTDGGQTWEQISNGAAVQLDDIVMHETGLGVAVGDAILRTTDFGRTWKVVHGSADFRGLEAVEILDADTVVAGGEFGMFLRSEDAGMTWTELGELPGRQCHDLSFISLSEGWAFGTRNAPNGFIAHTTDGGQSWTLLTDTHQFPVSTEGQVLPSLHGWALIPQTEHTLTTDGFVTDIPRQLPNGDSWQEFEYGDEQVGWYGGFYGGLLKTTNGGYIFTSHTLPGFNYGGGLGDDRITDIRTLSADEAFICTLRTSAIGRGIIYHTTDGGATWTQLDHIVDPTSQFGGAAHEIEVLASGSIWALGNHGFIFGRDLPATAQPATLADATLAFGSLLSGGVAELAAGDDSYLHGRSQFGFSALEPNIMDLVTGFTSPMPSPDALDFTIESRINNPGGSAKVRVKNFTSGAYEQVAAFSTSQQDAVNVIGDIAATDRVRASDGRIEVSTRLSVIATFSAAGFEAWFDHAGVMVR